MSLPGAEQQWDPEMLPQCSIKGIVLAGVHSWGNCALERVAPRPLVPVGDRPLVAHVLKWMQEGGVSTASICANSDTAALRRKLGNGREWGSVLDYYEDVMPRGPAGCIRDAASQSECRTYVVADATLLPRLNLADVLRVHASSGAALTVVASKSPASDTHPEGLLEPAGVYVVSRCVLEYIPTTGYQDIKEALIPRLHARKLTVLTHVIPRNQIARVTGMASYLTVSKWAVERLALQGEQVRRSPSSSELGGTSENAYLRQGQACVHPSAEVARGARLVGPLLIGPGCRIKAGALIAGPTALGAGCEIDEAAVVSRSVLWSGSRVGAGAVVDHSVLTESAGVRPRHRLTGVVVLPERRSLPTWLGRRSAGPADEQMNALMTVLDREAPNTPVPVRAPAATASGYVPVVSPVSVSAARWDTAPMESKRR